MSLLPKTINVSRNSDMNLIATTLLGLLLCSVACSENPAPKTVDLRTMLNLISENIVAAEEEYKDQHVQLDGEIRVIEKNKVRLVPISSDIFQVSGVDCFLASDEKKHLGSLRKGDNLTVMGRVKSINTILVYTVNLENCHLYPTLDTPVSSSPDPSSNPKGCEGLEKLIPQIKEEVFQNFKEAQTQLLGSFPQSDLKVILDQEIEAGNDDICQERMNHFLNSPEKLK